MSICDKCIYSGYCIDEKVTVPVTCNLLHTKQESDAGLQMLDMDRNHLCSAYTAEHHS